MKSAYHTAYRPKRLWQKWQVWVFILLFGVIGSIILTRSHAATSYTVRSETVYISNSDGCWLAGRKWDTATTKCTTSCRSSNSTYVSATSTRHGYCTGAVATSVGSSTCKSYARRYIYLTGCSRKIEQVTDLGATQCIYSNDTYYPYGDHDYCTLICPSGYTKSTTSHICVPPVPKVTLTASPATVLKGAGSTLTWSSQNVSSCTASGSWSGAKPGSGSVGTGALGATASYTLSCSGAGGTATAKATVTVTTPTSPTTPTPTTTPKPTPTPTKPGSSTPTRPQNNTDSAPKAGANGSVAAGTLSAKLTAPPDGAQAMYVLYGTQAEDLSESSETVTFNGGDAQVTLAGLQAKTKYYYQIIRTFANGQDTTSATASFDTTGYAITLHLIGATGKPIEGIPGVINDADDTAAKSDKHGDMKFFDLDAGEYTVKYRYNNLTYSKNFNTDSAVDNESTAGKTAVLSDTINVSKLKNGSTQPLPTKKHSVLGKVVLFLLIIGIGAAIVWLFLRRRARQNDVYGTYQPSYNAPPASNPVVVSHVDPLNQVEHTKPVKSKKASHPAESPENLEHVGESLREMVVRSMHEEAQKRKNQQ